MPNRLQASSKDSAWRDVSRAQVLLEQARTHDLRVELCTDLRLKVWGTPTPANEALASQILDLHDAVAALPLADEAHPTRAVCLLRQRRASVSRRHDGVVARP
jgi:hypothetical protein